LLGAAYKQGVLELNASDARGIDVVRNRIKSFAMNKVTLPPGRYVNELKVWRVSFKKRAYFVFVFCILIDTKSLF
jgi:DNA polymerase III delta prime subunit